MLLGTRISSRVGLVTLLLVGACADDDAAPGGGGDSTGEDGLTGTTAGLATLGGSGTGAGSGTAGATTQVSTSSGVEGTTTTGTTATTGPDLTGTTGDASDATETSGTSHTGGDTETGSESGEDDTEESGADESDDESSEDTAGESESGDQNSEPTANDGSFATDVDTAVVIDLPASDPDGDALTYEIVEAPRHGQISPLRSGPELRYTPNAGYVGSDEFRYRVNDGQAVSEVATIQLEIAGGPDNRAPVAESFEVQAIAGSWTTIRLRGTDPDGDPLTYKILGRPRVGQLTGTAPNFRYQNSGTGQGEVTLTYLVRDAELTSNIATVTIDLLHDDGGDDGGGDDGGDDGNDDDDPVVGVVHVVPAGPAPLRAGARTEDGETWETAFTSFSRALAHGKAMLDDHDRVQFWLAEGVHRPDVNPDADAPDDDDPERMCHFELAHEFAVYGGFEFGDTRLSQRNSDDHPTVLSADVGVVDDTSDNCYHVVKLGTPIARRSSSTTDDRLLLDGVTLTKGNADGTTHAPDEGISTGCGGGALLISGATAKLRNVRFEANAGFFGGGLCTDGADVEIVDSQFETLDAGVAGGAMSFVDSQVLLTNSSVANAVAAWGGAMWAMDSLVNVQGSQFNHNAAIFGGGAIYFEERFGMHIDRSEFKGNEAEVGGAIFFDGIDEDDEGDVLRARSRRQDDEPTTTVTNSTLVHNRARYEGGAIYNDDGAHSSIENCFFGFNQTTDEDDGGGGAITNQETLLPIIGCTFVGNTTANDGGAIFNDAGDSVVVNAAFARNFAVDDGGAISNFEAYMGLVEASVFHRNAALDKGGAAKNTWTDTTWRFCEFDHNGSDHGGAVYNDDDSEMHITSSGFFGNQSVDEGGALANRDASTLMMSACGFLGNRSLDAEDEGGAVYNSTTSSAVLESSTFFDNGPTAIADDSSAIALNNLCQPETNPFVSPLEGSSIQLFLDPGGDVLANTCFDSGSAEDVNLMHADREDEVGDFIPDWTTLTTRFDGTLDENAEAEAGLDASVHYAQNEIFIKDADYDEDASELYFRVRNASQCRVDLVLESLEGAPLLEFSKPITTVESDGNSGHTIDPGPFAIPPDTFARFVIVCRDLDEVERRAAVVSVVAEP